MLAVVCLAFSVCTFSVALSMDADADLGDEGEDDDDGFGGRSVLPEQHLGADTQAIVEGGAACAQLTLMR